MIGRFRDACVDRIAAGSGALAFVRWLATGVVLQVLFMAPFTALLFLVFRLPEDVQPLAGGIVFLTAFLSARWFLFASPCAEVGVLKRRGSRGLWLVLGMLFGALTLASAAALEPKRGA